MSSRRRMMMATTTRKASQIPLRDKIILSSGKKFVLMGRNLPGHPQDSMTLVGEHVYGKGKWEGEGFGIAYPPEYGAGNNHAQSYSSTDMHKTILPGYYNELNGIEKNAIIKWDVKYTSIDIDDGDINYGTVNTHFYIPGLKEWSIGGANEDSHNRVINDGTPFGFASKAERIKTTESGQKVKYFLRVFECYDYVWKGDTSYFDSYLIDTAGNLSHESITQNGSMTSYILPCCDIKGTTKCKKGADGYWRIVEK